MVVRAYCHEGPVVVVCRHLAKMFKQSQKKGVYGAFLSVYGLICLMALLSREIPVAMPTLVVDIVPDMVMRSLT